jgi:hypothetical protein
MCGKFLVFCGKLRYIRKNILYFRKNYDMSGNIFVCLRKLRYIRKMFGMSEKLFRDLPLPPPRSLLIISGNIVLYCGALVSSRDKTKSNK